ncbi:hypothetical protein LCGC14_1175530 [marine sediment metagenome]|uniref:Uncharacterized protein n=1 Tax=marine sediment metagenome TaxID=412755 RepID=A0A0F9LTG4_9ZZZZ
MTDKDVKQPKHKKIVIDKTEKGKISQFEGKMGPDEVREALNRIQQTILSRAGSKHMIARIHRKFHRHFSPKAKLRKKNMRRIVKKSRRINAKKKK